MPGGGGSTTAPNGWGQTQVGLETNEVPAASGFPVRAPDLRARTHLLHFSSRCGTKLGVTDAVAPKPSWTTWLLALLLATASGLAAWGWHRAQQSNTQLQEARAATMALEQRVAATDKQARLIRNLEDEVARLQRQTDELHQLRGQFQELQQLRAERDKLQSQNQQLQQAQQALSSSLRQAQAQAQTAGATPARPEPVSWIGIAMNQQSVGGVGVQSVIPGGPADGSGLEVDDLIVAVDGQPVANAAALRDLVGKKPVGQPVVLDVQREDAMFRVTLTTGAFPR